MESLPGVIIAEDNAELRTTMKFGLEAAGYEVRAATNGAGALAQNARSSDILITDLFMPDMDGFEAIDTFKRRFPATRILVISGEAGRVKSEYLSAAALIGVDATLKKPLDLPTLLAALEDLGR
jgi:ATP-dependent Lon protease